MAAATQRHSEPLNLRVSLPVRQRIDALVERYDLTITSVSRLALVIGIEALEQMTGEVPEGTFPADPAGSPGG